MMISITFFENCTSSSIEQFSKSIFIDRSIFAGRMISEVALAAIGQTFPIYFIIIALGIGLSIATTVLLLIQLEKRILVKDVKFLSIFRLAIFVGILYQFLVFYLGLQFWNN